MKKIIMFLNVIISLAMVLGVNEETEETVQPKPIPIQIVEEIEIETEPEVQIVEFIEEIEPVQEIVPEKEYRYLLDCPLSEELQEGIFDICEEYNVSFEFVMAVIMQESSFKAKALGDNGNSKGLMQIQERWHSGLMKELGVSDLYVPLDNVKVGVALLHSYFEELGDVYHVLMRYNGGEPYATNMMKAGKVSDYAREVTERAIEYEESSVTIGG